MGGDTTATGAHSTRALEVAERTGLPVPPEVATMCGSHALFEGRLDDAVRWYHRAVELAATAGDEAQRGMTTGSEILALGYAGDERAASLAETVLAEIDGSTTPYAAYVWYCAAEADLTIAPERAPSRFARALEAAEEIGRASCRERVGQYVEISVVAI